MILPSVLAYIDPMSGSIVLQVILAGVISVIAFFRRPILKLFGKKPAPTATPEAGTEQKKAA